MSYEISPLKSGLRLLTAPSTGTAAVTVMVFAGAGSRYESRAERGIGHFLEHMFFKGGKRYPTTKDVSAAIDGVGGDFNAFTGKEYAGYYVKVAADHRELACDVISDMLLHASFPSEEIDRERGVIIEEERMYQDTPMYRAGWDFEELLFGDHPLGWDTIGTEEVIRRVTQADFRRHKEELYGINNLILAIAGNVKIADARALAERFFGALAGRTARRFPPFSHFGEKRVYLRTKETEQAHLVLGVPGLPALHNDHFAFRLLAIALGGNMSSRMFLRIREAKGLCYYIATETDHYLDAGALSTRAGVDQRRLHEAIRAIAHEYALCRERGITDEELTRAKEFLKGKLILSLEDSEERAHYYGKQALLYPTVRDIPAYIQEIDRVDRAQVNRLAETLLRPEELRLVVIGRERDEAALRRAMLQE